jgi:signal transduction histidine kinase
MNPFRSVGARLSLALVVVVAAALGLVDLIVVPSLERNLIHAKIAQLEDAARGLARQIDPAETYNLDPVLQSAAQSANARISVLGSFDSKSMLNVADSTLGTAPDLLKDPIALRASQLPARSETSGTIVHGDDRFAEAARSLGGGYVVLLSASLHDSLANINLVRGRLVIAGLIALGASLLVGFGGASVFARRLRRLEQAAERIAAGDFSQPVVDKGRDEVGQLATAFEEMRRKLAGLERARREFIANASHELRTPLFSLGGFLELLENEDLDATTQREFLGTMREQIDRLTKLATDLLDLSRLDAGRLHVESEPVDLGALAQTLADEFHAVALANGHRLEVVERASPSVVGDEERALQIGRILVENAIVHTPSGTLVRLSTARRDQTALLTVEDDGPGIPGRDVPHVFDRFYRVDGSTAAGSGLGLAIARELADVMRGTLELHVTPGRTIFALVLPLAQQDASVHDGAGFPVETESPAGSEPPTRPEHELAR